MLTDCQPMQHWIPRRRPVIVLLLATGLAILASATPVSASPLTSQRAPAARVMAQLDLLQARHDQAVIQEREAADRLASARAELAANSVQMAAARRSLAAARAALAATLVSSYKSGSRDTVSYVLASGSFSDLLSRFDLLSRTAAGDHDLIGQIRQTQRLLDTQRATRQAAAESASQAHAAAVRARDALTRTISRRRAVLASADARTRRLLAREQSRRAGLATATGGGGTADGGSPPSREVFYGECTWYGPGFAGHPTASGEIFDPQELTAASPWLPFGTRLTVTNLATGLSVQVRVNDRGPFGRGVLDLSAHAAEIVHLSGWQRVRIEIAGSGPPAARSIMP